MTEDEVLKHMVWITELGEAMSALDRIIAYYDRVDPRSEINGFATHLSFLIARDRDPHMRAIYQAIKNAAPPTA